MSRTLEADRVGPAPGRRLSSPAVTRFLVASNFRWDEYPGLRPGRIYRGAGDVGRSPLGETHLVAGPDAVETICGLPRASFPHDFPESADSAVSQPCPTCGAAAS